MLAAKVTAPAVTNVCIKLIFGTKIFSLWEDLLYAKV